MILASWNDGDRRAAGTNAFFAWMLALEGLAIGVFAATDVFLFYVLFEATLIPLYFLIGSFGGPQRSYAAVKFLIYNLVGGLLMLAAIVGLYVVRPAAGGPSYLLSDLVPNLHMSAPTPSAGCSSASWPRSRSRRRCGRCTPGCPTPPPRRRPGTSVLMVSVLDKIGTFGMMRFCLGLFPEASTGPRPVVSCSRSSASSTAPCSRSARTTSAG